MHHARLRLHTFLLFMATRTCACFLRGSKIPSVAFAIARTPRATATTPRAIGVVCQHDCIQGAIALPLLVHGQPFRRIPARRLTSIATTSSIEASDAPNIDARFTDLSALEAMLQARCEFQSTESNVESYDLVMDETHVSILEPDVSAVQLVALALQLPWETGYRDLMQLLMSHDDSNNSLPPRALTPESSVLGPTRLSLEDSQRLHSYMERRLRYEPLQYICGQWDFLDYTLTVRSPLLCPRPETEELVQLVVVDADVKLCLAHLDKTNGAQPLRILDVGCGTGCIGIALADQLPRSHVTAIDVEPIAVKTAAENAQRILLPQQRTNDTSHAMLPTATQPSKDAYFYESESYRVMLASAQNFTDPQDDLFHLVVSNPPYIPAADMDDLDPVVRSYESPTALYGGSDDGMQIIRTIVDRLPTWCHVNATCWLEVDPSHPPLLEQWLLDKECQRNRPDGSATDTVFTAPTKRVAFDSVHEDLSNRARFVKLRVVE